MYTLYSRRGTAGFAVEALLEEIGAPYELIDIEARSGSQTPEAFRALNPLGQVPALVLPGGTVLTESAAIMIYLADAHADAGLGPRQGEVGRAPYLRWLVFLATNLYISFRHVYHADSYAPLAQGEAVSQMARQSVLRDFRLVEAALDPGPYILDDRFSAADIYLAMFPDWHWDCAALLVDLPRISRLRDIVMARPAIAPVHARHSA